MSICKNCLVYISKSYSHQTLGSVCPICLRPIKNKPNKVVKKRKTKHNKLNYNNGYIHNLSKKRKEEIESCEKRDNYVGCRVCGTTENLTIDHIIPKSLKGQNIMSNKQVLCLYCNNLKGDLPPGENGWWPDSLMEYLNSFSAPLPAEVK